MFKRMRLGTKLTLVLWVVLGISPLTAFAAEARIDEAGLVFDLPDAWGDKVEKSRIPTGQLMQRWARSPMTIQAGTARPGMIALATPVPKDANLVLITQARLLEEPFHTKIPDAECMKCVRYKARLRDRTLQAISFEPPPDCQETAAENSETPPCEYERIQRINLALEPSWAFLMEKQVAFGPMKILLIHALVDGKLLEVTFSYPAELAETVEAEIGPIISSIRKP